MLRNYLKIIGRNLWRNKLYTLINIFGLGVGIATMVWGFQNYRFSFSFDNFHTGRENIFRVVTKSAAKDNLTGVCPMPLAMSAKNDFAGVKEAVRWDSRGLDIKSDQHEPFASTAHFTDPAFFKLFNFPLVKGTANLDDRSTVLITEKAATTFFGKADPIGKTLIFYSAESYKLPLTVTGVLKDPPLNSSLRFEVLTNFDNQYKPDGSIIKPDDWNWFVDAVFLQLPRPADAANLANELKKYVPLQQEANKDFRLASFAIQSFADVSSNAKEIENNGLWQRPEDSSAFAPLILAILILLSACLNFANTSVAQSNRRLKEMGVRKVMGSSYRQIVFQQLLECGFVVLLAIGLSVVINNFWLPTYNAMFTYLNLTANYFTDRTLLLFMVLLLVGVTLAAGAYPAFYISRFNATKIFRGSVKFGGSNLFSRLLLGLQIVISFITVIAGMAFSRNAEFQRTYDYGYDKENVVVLNLQGESAYAPVRNELSRISSIDKMAGTKDQVGFTYRGVSMEAKGEKKNPLYLEIGANYLNVMGLKLVAGRAFNSEGSGDYNRSMLINEKLAYEFGWKPAEAVGQQIRKNDSTICTVVGVLKDITQNSLFEPQTSIAMCMIPPENYRQLIIHAKPGTLVQVYDQVKTTWANLYPMKPLRAVYQDEVSAEGMRVNDSIATIFFWFAIISMIMAATGMFALVSLSVMKKMREIAIRKVVGANGRHIFQLVLKGYLWIFLLAAGIGCYAGLSLARLLMDMIFRINAGVSIASLTLSFVCVLLISAITIGSRVWYATHKKAIDVLKAN